jgi:multidrug efflux pump subunit AcrA (membrane-fusion protein)
VVLCFAAVVALGACSGAEEASSDDGYHPSTVEEVAGSDLHLVTLTEDAAARIGLQTVPVEQSGDQVTVPYAGLIYDGDGAPWVYVAEEERAFQRRSIVIDRIEGDQVLVSEGLQAGELVATVGATEVYGTELGIDGSH